MRPFDLDRLIHAAIGRMMAGEDNRSELQHLMADRVRMMRKRVKRS